VFKGSHRVPVSIPKRISGTEPWKNFYLACIKPVSIPKGISGNWNNSFLAASEIICVSILGISGSGTGNFKYENTLDIVSIPKRD